MSCHPGGETGMRDAMLRHQPYEYEHLEEIREAAAILLVSIDTTDDIPTNILLNADRLRVALQRKVIVRDA